MKEQGGEGVLTRLIGSTAHSYLVPNCSLLSTEFGRQDPSNFNAEQRYSMWQICS
jgi:hypothetical protein